MYKLPNYDNWLVEPFEREEARKAAEERLLEELEQDVRTSCQSAAEAVDEFIGSTPENVRRWECACQAAAENGDTEKLVSLINDAIKEEAIRRLEDAVC